MKNIKLRIVYLILCSALLLFALFMLAVNLIIPAHFVREAKKALISEAQYQNRTIPYTDDGSFFDDEWNDTEEHFLTPSIVFLELDNANQSSVWNRDAYRLEKELLEYCKGRDLSLNQCYTFKTDRHHLIFMSAQENYGDGEEPYSYIMYIDIGPITRYIVTLNWVFFAVLLAISSVMCLLGFRFGRDIEKEAERQQTFFQNASHELKTPLMAIQGYAEGIQAGVMDTGGAADVILEESDRMTELVEELLGEENELMDGLQSGRFDLVIARDSMISPQKYHFVPLAKDRLCVMLPIDHPLAEKSSLTIADIAREPLILMHPYTSIYQLCMQLFEKADQKPHILRTARLESIISSVEVGEALSLFAGSNFALFHHPNVTAVPLRDAPPLVIGAAYPLKMKASKKPGNISAQTLKSFVFFIQNPV